MSRGRTSGLRAALLTLAAIRCVLGLIAIPLAAALYERHFVVVVALRPTKEILLAAGFLMRQGKVGLVETVAAAVPLAILGVWLFYALGRSYRHEIQTGEGIPRWVQRVLRPHRIQALERVLERKGRRLVVVSRLAVFPSALLGAAAGASRMAPAQFLPADALGAVLSVGEVLGAGYVFGAAYKQAGPWLTGVGVAVLVGLLVLLGRWLGRDDPRADASTPGQEKAAASTPGRRPRRGPGRTASSRSSSPPPPGRGLRPT